MLEAVITAKLPAGFGAKLWKDVSVKGERYEVHRVHPTGVETVVTTETSLDAALDMFFQLVKDLVVTYYGTQAKRS